MAVISLSSNIGQIRRRSVLIILGLIFVLLATVVTLMFSSVRQQDRAALANNRALVQSILTHSLARLLGTAVDYANWDDSVSHLALLLDRKWADENIGSWITESFGIYGSAVFDDNGQQLYAYLPLKESETLVQPLAPLVARALAAPAGEARGYMEFEGELFAMAAARILPQNWQDIPSAQWPPPRVLVFFKRIADDSALAAVTASLGFHRLHIESGSVPTTPAHVAIQGIQGQVLGHVAWEIPAPGHTILRQIILPGTLGMALVTLLFLLLLIRTLKIINALQERESTLRLNAHALGSISQGVLISDDEHRITYVNDAFCRITGWQSLEILGQPMTLLSGPHTNPAMAQEIQAALEGNSPLEGEVLHYRRDGMPFWNEFSITPVCDSRNRSCRFISTHHDITRRKQAEETLARRLRYEKSIASLSNVLLTNHSTDPVPKALEHLLEAARVDRVYLFQNFQGDGDLCTRQTHEVCSPGVPPELDNPELQNVSYTTMGHSDLPRLLAAGEIVMGPVRDFPSPARELMEMQGIVSILILPIFVAGQWHGFIGFDDVHQVRTWDANDIRLLQTSAELIGIYLEQCQNRQALERLNQQLEQQVDQEVHRRQHSERAMIQQSRTAAMGEMVTAIAHHWRQPLGAIALQVELLQQICHEGKHSEMEEVNEITHQVIRKVQELSTTIDNLYGFSQRNEAARIASIPDQVRVVVNLLQPQFRDHFIVLNAHLPSSDICTSIFPAAFKQSIFNLLINARDAILIKRSHSDQVISEDRVDITVSTSKAMVHIVVEDSGTGIDEKILERIFDPFFTTRQTSRGDGIISGTGTGLYMVKLAIEGQMGGWITVGNTEKGARFEITLPREDCAGQGHKPSGKTK